LTDYEFTKDIEPKNENKDDHSDMKDKYKDTDKFKEIEQEIKSRNYEKKNENKDDHSDMKDKYKDTDKFKEIEQEIKSRNYEKKNENETFKDKLLDYERRQKEKVLLIKIVELEEKDN